MGRHRGRGEAYLDSKEAAGAVEPYAHQHPERLKRMVRIALAGGGRRLLGEAEGRARLAGRSEMLYNRETGEGRKNPTTRRMGSKSVGMGQEEFEQAIIPPRFYLGRKLRDVNLGVPI
jgi:hypothetical protein